MTDAVSNEEIVEVKGGTPYPEHHISAKTLKLWMANATTPEQRKIFASMMPKPQKKYSR